MFKNLKLGDKLAALAKTKTFAVGAGIALNALYQSQTTDASFSDAVFQGLMGLGMITNRYAGVKRDLAQTDPTSGASTSSAPVETSTYPGAK